jgi:menaquinone-dependent protoporphyrinogen oxidase
MEKNVLVAYATKYGATEGIALKIAQVLREAGLATDIARADRIVDLTPYTAVVLGSAVYIGRWRREAVKFLQNHEEALAQRPVWIFSSGPMGEGDPETLTDGWRLPGSLQPVIDRIKPRDVALFGGAVDTDRLNFLEKWMLKNVQAPAGDFRDWDAITAWAQAVAAELLGEAG